MRDLDLKELFIDEYEVLVEYGSIKYKRPSRVNVNESLSDGNPVFHVAGLSKVLEISLEILVPIYDSDFFEHLDEKVYNNERINVNNTFGKIFPNGEYYIKDGFEPQYLDSKYYKCSLNLIYFDGIEVTELFSYSAVSTNEAILSDSTSIVNITKFNDIGEGSNDSATVKKIQEALRRNGFYLKDGESSLLVDGIYGKYTTKAVQEFQKSKGISVTGIVNEETAKLLNI